MKSAYIGFAAMVTVALSGPAFGQNEEEPDGFQQNEMPGSEFQLDIDSGGKVEFGRESTLEKDAAEGVSPEPLKEKLELGSDPLGDPLDDPDNPVDPDPIDEELPGEGPESLSGPDDEDPLPY
ncbi:hypothetical protein AUC68_03540 [Methyloceanibacter methanicus]|uniref:Uncharacterized protein n=1 Tax=Methyloceanibacter methanicus TaxID=1774968 RepID=A0A1E3W300_9HYPH|nr:hypothetical protein [Methyloceanibacter methanicus]ODS00189.1 hypothetical protein AUC68_03540 [Methyloceanibacter methanicus]